MYKFISIIILSLCYTIGYADTLQCGYGHALSGITGTFNGTLPNGNGTMFTFTDIEGNIVISSFNTCQVVISKEKAEEFKKTDAESPKPINN